MKGKAASDGDGFFLRVGISEDHRTSGCHYLWGSEDSDCSHVSRFLDAKLCRPNPKTKLHGFGFRLWGLRAKNGYVLGAEVYLMLSSRTSDVP